MKTILSLAALVLLASPLAANAQQPYPTAPAADRQTYVTARAGAAVPQHDDLEGFDSGFSFEVALGRRMARNLAIEGSVGRYGVAADLSAGPLSAEMRFAIIPVAATAKLIAPAGNLDFYGLLGLGLNFVDAEVEESDGFTTLSGSDSGTAFALHVGGGLSASLAPNVALGVELRYVASRAEVFEVEGGLDSVLVSGGLAFRF
jgi:opacity protein-like surface antigen